MPSVIGRRRIVQPVSDIRRLEALLGGPSNLIAIYDARFRVEVATGVAAWRDARGSGYGPALVQATTDAQPVYSASARTITFDGTDDYLRSTSGWSAITASCWIALIGTLPAGSGANQVVGRLSSSNGSTSVLSMYVASAGALTAQAGAAPSATRNNPGDDDPHVFLGRRTQVAGDVTAGARLDNGAEGTGAATLAAATATWFTLGAGGTATAAGFASTAIRAVLIGAGDISAQTATAIAEWARATHRLPLTG